jgi:hypothetical protein
MALRTVSDPATLAALRARLARLTLDHERRWGSMTAQQMAVHLAEVAEGALGRRSLGADLRPNRLLMAVALYLPLPWPRGIKTGLDPASAQLRAEDFDADLERAVQALEAVAAAHRFTLRHPVFGPLTRAQWHRWAYLHADHHLRQFGL